MNQTDWLDCSNPEEMLRFLRASRQASERKLRLFAAACCRRFWHLLDDPRIRAAVEVAERFADQEVGEEQLAAAGMAAGKAVFRVGRKVTDPLPWAPWAALQVAYWERPGRTGWPLHGLGRLAQEAHLVGGAWAAALLASHHAANAVPSEHRQTESLGQCRLLHDILGPLPFRTVAIDPSWLAWHDRVVVKLARAVYQDRELPSGRLDSGGLAVLADALQDSGFEDEELLSHLRQQEVFHTVGCWAVDLVLGKT
jgi:hypothetical protein